MPNQAQFANQTPSAGQIRVLYRKLAGQDPIIKAITVSTESTEGTNVSTSLRELEQIKFIIDQSGTEATLNIESGRRVDGYYYFDVEDLVVNAVSSSSSQPGYPAVVNIAPYLTTRFKNSNYDALLSNASTIRKSNFKYEVDRLEGNSVTGSTGIPPVRPTNWLAIMSGSAVHAEIQDSNYTTTGIINARYRGTKTDADTYGSISPAVSGKPFEAASYLTSSANNFICSQSLSDRTIETYLFEGIEDTPTLGSRVFQFDKSRVIPVTNRKVWVKDNRTVLLLDNLGYVAGSIAECSV